MNNETLISQWLKFARDDLLMARHAFEEVHPKQIFIACYHCQQASEKALKAYLIFKDTEFPYTHDLANLCYLCTDHDEVFHDILNDCSDLTPFAIQTRYPGNREITEEETASALRKPERIVNFCADLIKPLERE